MKLKQIKLLPPIQYWIFAMLWLVILLPKYLQLAFFGGLALLFLCSGGPHLRMNRVSAAMLLLFAVHIFAILYNLVVLDGAKDRLAAAINTALLWPVAAVYYAYYSCRKPLNMDTVGYCCCFNLLVSCVYAVITVYLFYFKNLDSFSMLGKTLYETTYLAGNATTKFYGLNDYSNMNLFYVMFNTALSLPYLRKQKLGAQLTVFAIASFEAFLIHSRAGMVLFVLSLAWCLLELYVPARFRKKQVFLKMLAPLRANKKRFILVFALLVVVVAVAFYGLWNIFWNKIINGNTSSNNLRLEIITQSIREAWEKSPVIGMGIKRYLIEGYPLGSHSTYVGFFYKTGIIGLVLGMFAFIRSNWLVLRRGFSNKRLRLLAVFLLSFVVLFAIEDVDGTNWGPVLYFSGLAILGNLPGRDKRQTVAQTDSCEGDSMLLFVTGSYPDSQDGIATGAKVLLDAMLEHVKAEDIFLLTTDVPEIRQHLERQAPVEYALMPNWRVTPANIRRFFQILDTHSIDTIHMEYPGNLYGKTFLASFLPALVKLYNCRRRKHISCHVRLHEFTQARFLRKVAILPILLFASSLYVPSMKDRQTVAKIAGNRVKATTIGTNIFVVPGRREPSDKVTISYFGFVYHGKGIEPMLALWQQLKAQDTGDKLRFRIIGDVGTEETNHFADYHKQVWQWIEEYGMTDAVSVTGYISDEEVSRELRNTDIATVLYEDGLTLRRGSFLAYLAHGVPIITTQGDAEAAALFEGHEGICMAQNQEQMLEQIYRWCDMPREQRDRIARDNEALSQHFAWDKIAQKFLTDYQIPLNMGKEEKR